MLEIVAFILTLIWLLGCLSAYTMGGYIHLLLALAIVLLVVRLLQGKNSSPRKHF